MRNYGHVCILPLSMSHLGVSIGQKSFLAYHPTILKARHLSGSAFCEDYSPEQAMGFPLCLGLVADEPEEFSLSRIVVTIILQCTVRMQHNHVFYSFTVVFILEDVGHYICI